MHIRVLSQMETVPKSPNVGGSRRYKWIVGTGGLDFNTSFVVLPSLSESKPMDYWDAPYDHLIKEE